jgi:hypothetical protein
MWIDLDLHALGATSWTVHLQTGSQGYAEFILAMPTGARAFLDDREVWRSGLVRRITDAMYEEVPLPYSESMGLTQPKLALNAQFGNRYEMVTGNMLMNHASHILILYFTWALRCA